MLPKAIKIGAIVVLTGLSQVGLADVQGFDISHYQPTVNFTAAKSSGAAFVIIKATEGTGYVDPRFSAHYKGATKNGLICGAYHFARPASNSGANEARHFLRNGAGWTGDGMTLPGMLDMEGTCSGLSASAMVRWIKDFSDTYKAGASRYPMIYTNPSWWESCTANSEAFSKTHPLVLARYASAPGTIPGGWAYQTIWQKDDSYAYGGDSDWFNGNATGLRTFATG